MDCDVLISGGGIAGLTAAAAFGSAGFSVLCVDPTAPVQDRTDKGADLRTTAILMPGHDLLSQIGVWDRLQSEASALQTMRIINLGEQAAPKDFHASDIDQEAFGWNLPNWFLRRELRARLDDLSNVTFQAGISATSYLGRSQVARVRLDDGRTVHAKLVLAADGRHSPMRKTAGIQVRTRRYGQKALVFAVSHATPHNNISTEIHRTGGPFTLVPLPDIDGRPSSAVVWMDDGPLQQQRLGLADARFNALITERSGSALGSLQCISPRSLWPIISQHAHQLVSTRLALIAEAAHVVPPIGAQGLNMSLKDIALLASLAKETPDRLGDPEMLARYERARLPDIRLRVAGIDVLNRASQSASPMMQAARGMALDALHSLSPVRHGLMHLGLGLKD